MTSVDGDRGVSAFEAFYRERREEAVRLAWLLTHDAAAARYSDPAASERPEHPDSPWSFETVSD